MKKTIYFAFVSLLTFGILSSCSGNDEPPVDIEPEMVSIEITTNPTKLEYEVGEIFDATGMVVSAVYDDETKEVLPSNAYTWAPRGALTLTDTQITIIEKMSNEGFMTTLPITVVPGEEVTKEASLWIEAENTKIEGTLKSGPLTCANVIKHEGMKGKASGDLCLYNFGQTVGNTLTMLVESSEDAKVRMDIITAKRPKFDVVFSGMYTIDVDGKTYNNDSTLPAANSGDYFDFITISNYIYLKEGVNTITITSIGETGANLDAFGFAVNKAILTDKTVANITHSDGVTVTKNPTTTEKGNYVLGCSNCGYGSDGDHELPMLNETDYTLANGYYSIVVKDGHGEDVTLKFAAGINRFRFECEDMELGGVVAAGSNKGSAANKADCVKDVSQCSEGKALTNMNKEGNTITLNFSSTQTTVATLSVNVAARTNGTTGYTKLFKEMYTTTINGADYDTTVSVVPNAGDRKALTDFYEMHLVVLGNIDIKSGDNTLVFTVAPGSYAGNLDFVEFETAATLSAKA